jgi:hypothetical protein
MVSSPLLDLCVPAIYVKDLPGTCRDSLIFELLLNTTTFRVHGVSPHFPRILGDHHAYQDIPSLLFN